MFEIFRWNPQRSTVVNVLAVVSALVLFPVLVGVVLLGAFVAAIFDMALKS